jgi:hypothetical protein
MLRGDLCPNAMLGAQQPKKTAFRKLQRLRLNGPTSGRRPDRMLVGEFLASLRKLPQTPFFSFSSDGVTTGLPTFGMKLAICTIRRSKWNAYLLPRPIG